MAEAPSEILDASGHDVSTDSETPSSHPLCDDTGQGDSDLWAIIEESAFQVLAQRFLIKRSSHSLCASEPDEESNLFSMTFPRKLWKIVGSDKFKSIWWDEAGTYIVINEELFKKEVLERKAPFRIFETDSMKSLVRQLNLYGFRKMRQNFQRSASLPDFLAEEKGVSASCKLQFYQNPNFLRDCPHLIERMKRRIGIKTASRGAAPSPPEFKNKHFSPDLDNMDDHSLGVAVQTRKRNLLSSPSISNVYLKQKSSTAQGGTDTMDGIRRDFSLATSSSFRPPEKILTHHSAPLNEVSPLHMDSQRIYTQANDSTMNFIITSIQNHRDVSHLWNSCIEMQAEPSFQPGYPHFSSSSSTYSDSKAIGEPKLPIYKERVVSTTLASALNHHPS